MFWSVVIFILLLLFFSIVQNANGAAMSIDLGSRFIKIALVKFGVPMEIILNRNSDRKSLFAIGIKNGERFFGEEAIRLGAKHPAYSFHSFLDLIGKAYDNPIVTKFKEQFPQVHLIEHKERGTVVFKTDEYEFPVETLLAMVLREANVQCERHAKQKIKDIVISIPTYFNQVERKAVAQAVEIAGLNLLQILSSGISAGLTYGFSNQKLLSLEKPLTILIYDIGYSKTIASIIELRLAKIDAIKGNGPVISTIGVGFDRTLGGGELTLRLQDYLLKKFTQDTELVKNILRDSKAMAKLSKEAERLKQVLSANNDHSAYVEGLINNRDFTAKVSRDEFQNLFADLEPRFIKVLDDALIMSETNIDKIDLVIPMGAGTRVPRIHQIIQNYIKTKSFSHFINTDEASAMGAIYQAAILTKGFRGNPFTIEELQLYPIEVAYTSGNRDGKVPTQKSSIIYQYKTNFPSKMISFNSFIDDFEFDLNYASFLSHLSSEQISYFGSLNISKVKVTGLKKALEDNLANEKNDYLHVKIHFNIDRIGLAQVVKAEAYFSKPKEDLTSPESVITAPLSLSVQDNLVPLSNIQEQIEILLDFEMKEKSKEERNNALNNVEATIYDSLSKFEDESFIKFGKSEELENLKNYLNELKIWFEDEVTPMTTKEELISKKKEIDKLINVILFRKTESEERPRRIRSLEKAFILDDIPALNDSNKDYLESLKKFLTETKEWLDEKIKAQSELSDNDDPILTSQEIKEKTKTIKQMKDLYIMRVKAELAAAAAAVAKAKREAALKEAEALKNETVIENEGINNNKTSTNETKSSSDTETLETESSTPESEPVEAEKETGKKSHDNSEL